MAFSVSGSKLRTTVAISLKEISLLIDELLNQFEIENLKNLNAGMNQRQSTALLIGQIRDNEGIYRTFENKVKRVIRSQIHTATAVPYKVAGQENPQQKFRWMLGDTVKHCSTCTEADGQVMTYEEWANSPYGLPMTIDGKKNCGGYNCRCYFESVDN